MSQPLILTSLTAIILLGCNSPLEPQEPFFNGGAILRTLDQELAEVESTELNLVTPQRDLAVQEALAGRIDELESMSPIPYGKHGDVDLGPSLTGTPLHHVTRSLQACVRSAINHNLALRSQRLSPAISRQAVIEAESAFDIIAGAGATYTNASRNELGSSAPAFPTYERDATTWALEGSLTQQLLSGGTVSLSTEMTRTDSKTGGGGPTSTPNPSWENTLSLGLSQPLMRSFGDRVTLAEVHIARTQERGAIESWRSELLDTILEVETTYWELLKAWQQVQVNQWLVNVAVEIRDILSDRRAYDANLAEWAQSVATVEERRANILLAQENLTNLSDQLKVLINEPDLTISTAAVIKPIDETVTSPMAIDLRDAMLTAVANLPEIRIALLSVEEAATNTYLADNARLPQLDLEAQLALQGQEGTFSSAWSDVGGGDFPTWVAGLTFQIPIGNRGPEAAFRQARLTQSQAMIAYRSAVQSAITQVRSAIRGVQTNGRLIGIYEASKIADAENLRALQIERGTTQGLTPTFLNLILSTQGSLASAQMAELGAKVDLSQAVATLYRSMGLTLEMHQIDVDIDDGTPSDLIPVQSIFLPR